MAEKVDETWEEKQASWEDFVPVEDVGMEEYAMNPKIHAKGNCFQSPPTLRID
jgi:hypothetical protein